MPTKTFSGRGEVEKLAYADALSERTYGMSYGQFCSSVLLDHVVMQHALPKLDNRSGAEHPRVQALRRMREMSSRLKGSKLASMADDELKAVVAKRYE